MNALDFYSPMPIFGLNGPKEVKYWDKIGARMDDLLNNATMADILEMQTEAEAGSLCAYFLKQAHQHWLTDHDQYMLNLIEAFKAYYAPQVQEDVDLFYIQKYGHHNPDLEDW